MSLRAFALDWSVDGPVGAAFLAAVVAVGAVYVVAGSARFSTGSAASDVAADA